MDRPTHDEDGRFIYYASELGGCLKALVAKRMGYQGKDIDGAGSPGGDRLRRIFAEGNLHEQAVIDVLRDQYRWMIKDQQRLVTMEVGVPGAVVMGHIDGIGAPEFLNWCLVEIKTMGADGFKEFSKHRWNTPGLVQKYKWQISVYAMALKMQHMLVVKNRNDGAIIIEGPHNSFYTYDDIQTRVLTIETLAESGILPDECDFNNYPCPFEYLHTEDKIIRKDSEVDVWGKEYLQANDEVKKWEARRREARELLEKALGDLQKLETINGTRVVRYEVGPKAGQVRYDIEALVEWVRSQFPDDVVRFVRTGEGKRGTAIRVTVRKDPSDNDTGAS